MRHAHSELHLVGPRFSLLVYGATIKSQSPPSGCISEHVNRQRTFRSYWPKQHPNQETRRRGSIQRQTNDKWWNRRQPECQGWDNERHNARHSDTQHRQGQCGEINIALPWASDKGKVEIWDWEKSERRKGISRGRKAFQSRSILFWWECQRDDKLAWLSTGRVKERK